MSTNLDRWLGRTAYQIIPDRYCKVDTKLKAIPGRVIKSWDDRMPNWRPNHEGEYLNDYFYCGNLKGIESKLKYIKNLGFDMIYLTPIASSCSYHHYDTTNHMEVDPWLGTWDDFSSLCKKAHKLGILVMVDLVFNHTGIHSIYYNNPKYGDWFKRGPDGQPVFWWGFKDLPECDTLNKQYQEAMKKVTINYLQKGADGIRLDLAEGLPKEFLMEIQSVKKDFPNAIIIGEMWGIATDKDDPKIFDGQLDSVMNYPLADAILRWVRYGKVEHFCYNFNRVYNEYPISVQNLLLNNIATHDTPTTMTMLGGEMMNDNIFDKQIWDIEGPWRNQDGFDTYHFREFEAEHDEIVMADYIRAKSLTEIAIAIMYMLPGIPCIYQGTEIADTGYKDPFNRKPYNWKKHEYDTIKFVSEMGKIRKKYRKIFAEGKVRILNIDYACLSIERYTENGESIILTVNRTKEWQYTIFMSRTINPKVILNSVNYSGYNWIDGYGIIITKQ